MSEIKKINFDNRRSFHIPIGVSYPIETSSNLFSRIFRGTNLKSGESIIIWDAMWLSPIFVITDTVASYNYRLWYSIKDSDGNISERTYTDKIGTVRKKNNDIIVTPHFLQNGNVSETNVHTYGNVLIRSYELNDHEIENTENDYFLSHGYSRVARDSVHAGMITLTNSMLKILSSSGANTAESRALYESMNIISCKVNHVLEWEASVHEATHRIKLMNPRPETELQALAFYDTLSPAISNIKDKISEILSLTGPQQIKFHHNQAWIDPNDQIKSHISRLDSILLFISDSQSERIPVNLNFNHKVLEYNITTDKRYLRFVATFSNGSTMTSQFNNEITINPSDLKIGKNVLSIVITAEDGVTKTNYIFNITREVENV